MRSIRRSGADFRSNGLIGGARSAAAVKPFEWSKAELNISPDRTDRASGPSYRFSSADHWSGVRLVAIATNERRGNGSAGAPC